MANIISLIFSYIQFNQQQKTQQQKNSQYIKKKYKREKQKEKFTLATTFMTTGAFDRTDMNI